MRAGKDKDAVAESTLLKCVSNNSRAFLQEAIKSSAFSSGIANVYLKEKSLSWA